ncbi:MAG: hypothetical protein IPK71_09765 [Myxococcales bacterium]|nr:hypothetical protein [Myxococcales bacterium]
MRPEALASALTAALVLVPCVARAELPSDATSWNQLGQTPASGLSRGSTTLATNLTLVRPAGTTTLRLGFSFEHLLRDRWGLVGGVAAPFGGVLFAPAYAGVRFHVLPRSPLDPYLGVTAGLAIVHPKGEVVTAEPTVGAHAGLALHYVGFAFVAFDGGLEHATYASAASRTIFDLTTYTLTWRTGVSF